MTHHEVDVIPEVRIEPEPEPGHGDGSPAIDGSPTPEERERRLAEGADELVGSGQSVLAHPRFLLIASATVMSFGLTAILLGWLGAARSTLVEEQLPYLISGGLFGLALAIIGGLMLFTHWLTVSVREARAHEAARRADHEALVAALGDMTAVLRQENTNGRARGTADQRPLRAAPRGS